MPNYDFRFKPTGQITERFMSIAEMETFIKDNPDYEVAFLKMQVGDPVLLGVKGVPSDFTNHVIAPIENRLFKKRRETRFATKKAQV